MSPSYDQIDSQALLEWAQSAEELSKDDPDLLAPWPSALLPELSAQLERVALEEPSRSASSQSPKTRL